MTTEARTTCSRWFDDLEPGMTFATHGRTISEYDIVGFGTLTGDCNAQHFDAEFMRSNEFGERIAHGMLVLSYTLGMIPIDPDRLVALRGVNDVRFKRPVRIGDTIHVEVKLAECTAMTPAVGLVVQAARVVNQDGQVVARGNIETLWRREPGAAEEPVGADGAADAAAPAAA